MKKIICAVVTAILIFSFSVSASALSLKSGDDKYEVDIPKGFYSFTAENIYDDSSFFSKMPISKQQAIERVKNGVRIDAFSDDNMREIKFTTGTDSLSEKIVNLTPLSDSQIKEVAETVKTGIGKNAGTVLSVSTVKQSSYSFIKYSVRIGDTSTGYCYTSMMTIIAGKYYELTCYNSAPELTDEMIEADREVMSSLKIKIKGNSGDIGYNTFQSVVSIVLIIAAVLVIIGVAYTFIVQIADKRKQGESVTLQKRK